MASDNIAPLCTRLALERTMLAWLRARIDFGFAILEFFRRVRQLPGVEAGFGVLAFGAVTLRHL